MQALDLFTCIALFCYLLPKKIRLPNDKDPKFGLNNSGPRWISLHV